MPNSSNEEAQNASPNLSPGRTDDILLWVTLHNSEPRYQGRSLSSWLDAWAHGHTLDQQAEAKQAIVEIGTNAVRYLLKQIRYNPSRWKKTTTIALTKLETIPIVGRTIPFSMTTDAAAVRAETAVYAFDTLGETAAYAYGDLVRLACDTTEPEISERAIRVFFMRRLSAATAAVGLLLSNAPPQIRLKALAYIGAQHDFSVIRALRPALVQNLHDQDDEVARRAASALSWLKHGESEATLSTFLEALSSATPKVRAYLIVMIASYDTAAAPAVPSVVPFLTDADPAVRKDATNFLRMIAPESLTNSNPIRVH
jgi:HEAT repeat protein